MSSAAPYPLDAMLRRFFEGILSSGRSRIARMTSNQECIVFLFFLLLLLFRTYFLTSSSFLALFDLLLLSFLYCISYQVLPSVALVDLQFLASFSFPWALLKCASNPFHTLSDPVSMSDIM